MIRLFIEGQELDVNEGFTHQITYAVDDINNIDSKATAFSKTIVLPGTSNNNKLLGNIFEFGNSNLPKEYSPNVGYNFNAAKSAKVLVEINGLIILKGAMRLMEIIIDGENIEYEIALFGELGGFVAKLGNQRLQDLDFKEYDHTYNGTNIVSSWNQSKTYTSVQGFFDATEKRIRILEEIHIIDGDTITIANTVNNNGTFTVIRTDVYYEELIYNSTVTDIYVQETVVNGSDSTTDITIPQLGLGYYYPLIDYGKVSTDKQDFYYKTFRPAFYVREYIDKIITASGYTWESDFFNTNFFKRLIVPNNDGGFLRKDQSNYIEASTTQSYNSEDDFDVSLIVGNVNFYYFYFPTTSTVLNSFTYNSGGRYYLSNANAGIKINVKANGVYRAYSTSPFIRIIIQRNGVQIPIKDYLLPVTNNAGLNDLYPYDISFESDNYQIQTNDRILIYAQSNNNNTLVGGRTNYLRVDDLDITVSSDPAGFIEYQLNDLINVNNTLPYNVLQKDFFASILKMFNLMVTEDKYKEKHLIIEPWVDFYNLDRTSYLDWSEKMDRSEPIRIKPMSEVNSRYYEFKYKSDSDYYNEKYKKKFNEGYGDRKYDNQLEFAKETSTNEVIFSATPLVNYPLVNNGDKIISTIFKWDGTTTDKEEKVASNIRILQVKKITDVLGWDILADDPFIDQTPSPISGGSNLTAYGYAGHLDNPDAPNADLNFGATNELYFTLATGALSNNMFNAYYSSYMAEITDKDSRLLSAKFKLTEKDIFNLDFGRFIWVDGILYRLIKIYDYSEGELCKVDLLRVIYTTY